MGQFLAIGLATRIGVAKAEINAAHLTFEQLQERMRQDVGYHSEIYTVSESDNGYFFALKDAVFQEQLLPLLETLYPLLYKNAEYYDGVLQTLHTLPPSAWMAWAEGKPAEAFQFDRYGVGDSIWEKQMRIHLSYESLLLSMEGKVVMETYGRQFAFIKYTMEQAFRQFSLARALRIYITG